MTADHRSKNTPEEKQQFITQFKEIPESECIGLAKPARQLAYVGNYSPFQHSVAATFYPHLLKKEKGRFTGFKPNVKLEFGVGQLAFVRAKVNSWIMFLPDIESKTKE